MGELLLNNIIKITLDGSMLFLMSLFPVEQLSREVKSLYPIFRAHADPVAYQAKVYEEKVKESFGKLGTDMRNGIREEDLENILVTVPLTTFNNMLKEDRDSFGLSGFVSVMKLTILRAYQELTKLPTVSECPISCKTILTEDDSRVEEHQIFSQWFKFRNEGKDMKRDMLMQNIFLQKS